jgi:hypothetical protein
MSTPIHHRLPSALHRLPDPTLLRTSTLHHPRSPTTSALANCLPMACLQAVLAEEVVPTRHRPCLTLRPSQGLIASTLSLSPQAVLALKPPHTNVGQVGAMTIQTMMMRNLTLDPLLPEVVTLFHAIRKKFLFSIRPYLSNTLFRRRETVRKQRIESEQRRRDELREGYARLKETLPASNQKASKVYLLDRGLFFSPLHSRH